MYYLNDFLEWLKNEGKDEKTIMAYKATVNHFIQWYIETTGYEILDEVKPIDIKEYIGYMKHTLNRKQATINKSVASLKTFFTYLVGKGQVKDNPMSRIKLQKIESNDKVGEKDVSKWLSKEEQERFISYVGLEKNEFKHLRNLAIIDVMLYAGLRVAEVEELKIDDLKVNGDISITIREGKHGKYATVTLINKFSKNLRQWLKYRKSLKDDKYRDSPFLFASERTGKLTSRGIQVMLNKYAKLANMNNITPHRLRHSFCKNLANAGVSIETIRRLARHENIHTTAIYIDPSYDEKLKALSKM
jgi:site-specific recombinase XerD